MATEMGEYLVGAYLKFEKKCDVVDYNARPRGGRREGLGELDVIGLNFTNHVAYLCEVTTHLEGLLIGRGADATIAKIKSKNRRQRDYATKYLSEFSPTFMFWSPIVRSGLIGSLEEIYGNNLMINTRYTEAIDALRTEAKKHSSDANNPAFRVLQILEHMRRN